MASTSALIVIDGSQGEGGGALLRTALTMSALTQQSLRIDNVRGNTRFPGMDIEDLMILGALAKSCKAEVIGAEIGAPNVTFMPTTKPSGLKEPIESLRSENGRGPNALVVLNALIPVMAKTGVYSTLSTQGETYGFNSLSYDYFANVTVEALKKLGLYVIPDMLRPGFGRESEGEIRLEVEPSVITGVEWTERGSLRSVQAIVSTSGLPQSVADRALSHIKNLGSAAGIPVDIEHTPYSAKHTGAFITLWARYENGMGGGTAMGNKSIKAETLAQSAFDQLLTWMSSSATVDEFLADQLLLPLVFAEGNSAFSGPRLTQRLLTAVWVIKQFTPIHITVRGLENGPGSIAIQR
jgi:RNA 3'-terminal phosphate cyclase (ATP)